MISHQIMSMDSPFLFPLPCHDSLGQSRDLDLLIYISNVSVAHASPAMVLFFLFLFLPLTLAFVLTAVAMLCKPGCAVSAADTSSV